MGRHRWSRIAIALALLALIACAGFHPGHVHEFDTEDAFHAEGCADCVVESASADATEAADGADGSMPVLSTIAPAHPSRPRGGSRAGKTDRAPPAA